MIKVFEYSDKELERGSYKIANSVFQKSDKKLGYKEYSKFLHDNYNIPNDIINNFIDISFKFYLEMWYMSDDSNWIDFDEWDGTSFSTRVNGDELEIIK